MNILANNFILHVWHVSEYAFDTPFIMKLTIQPFKRKPHKMVKHTQTIYRQIVFDHFVGFALKGLRVLVKT